jgi:hypothetical protein
LVAELICNFLWAWEVLAGRQLPEAFMTHQNGEVPLISVLVD